MGIFSALMGSAYFQLFVVFQIICAIHCVKTGRNMAWLWIILMFSGVGCLVYFFAELLPYLRHSNDAHRTLRKVSGVFYNDRDLHEKSASFALSNNIETTCRYAEQLVIKGKYADAIDLYHAARKGIFNYDPVLLIGLAKVCFIDKRPAECIAALEDLQKHNSSYVTSDTQLLYAMALEQDEQLDAALQQYQKLGSSYPGPEAKCRYALLLRKYGEHDKAYSLFNEIRLYAMNAPRYYLQQHKEWVTMAQRECKAASQR